MVLNIDLKCSCCYKKIRGQVFDVDKNKVKMMVVCCSPEKIRDNICYKDRGAIQSTEIIDNSEKPKPTNDPRKQPADKPLKEKPTAGKPKQAYKGKHVDKHKEGDQKPKTADKLKNARKPLEAKPKNAAWKPPDAKPKDVGKPPHITPKDVGKPPETKAKDDGKPPEAKSKDGVKPKQDAPKKIDFIAIPGENPVVKMVYEPMHGYPHICLQSTYPVVGNGQYYDQVHGGAAYGGFGYEHGYNNGSNGNNSHYSMNHYGGEEEGEVFSIM